MNGPHRAGRVLWFAEPVRTMVLEPIELQVVVELNLTDREAEFRHATLNGHRSRFTKSVESCEKEEIYNLNGVTGRQLYDFRRWRRNKRALAPPGKKSQMDTPAFSSSDSP